MFPWVFSPLYRQIRSMVLKTAGKEAGRLLAKVNELWSQVVNGVDNIVLESVAEFIHDSALKGYPDKDHWKDKKNGDRAGFSIPLRDFKEFVIFRAVQLGPEKVKNMQDPWFTLSKLGMTATIQAETVSMIAKYQFARLMQSKVGAKIGEYGVDYVLVAIRPEAYQPMNGITELAKIAEASYGESPSATKKIFDKKIEYRRGVYDRTALLSSLRPNKFFSKAAA